MTPKLPLSHLRVPAAWGRAAERGVLVLHLSAWLLLPAAAWLIVSDELKLVAAGIIGAALMPLVLQLLIFPGHLLARRHGRAYAAGAAALTAGALCAWTWAAAEPVLEREHMPFLLRLLWAYCVTALPLAMTAAADEEALVHFVGAAQVLLGVAALAVLEAADVPVWTRPIPLVLFAAAAAWIVQQAWAKAHPPKR